MCFFYIDLDYIMFFLFCYIMCLLFLIVFFIWLVLNYEYL
jgi:hypothetical protein